MTRPALALLAVLAISLPAFAQEGTMLTGTCEDLQVGGKDLTGGCINQMLVAAIPVGGLITVVQSGGGAHNFYLAGEPRGKRAISRFEISFYPQEERWEEVEVNGSCNLGTLPRLPATITCQAVDARGADYRLRFVATTAEPLPPQ